VTITLSAQHPVRLMRHTAAGRDAS